MKVLVCIDAPEKYTRLCGEGFLTHPVIDIARMVAFYSMRMNASHIWRPDHVKHPLLLVLLTCRLTACGIEDQGQELVTELAGPTPAGQGGPRALQQAVHPSNNEAPLQITVLDGPGWDAEDSEVPQIYVPEEHREFVVSGAKMLLETATIDTDKATAVHLAQSALLSVAMADVVVLAEVVAEVEDADEPARKTVTMSTQDVIKGEIGATWSLDFPVAASPCGARSPGIGSQAVFFLRNVDGKLLLRAEGSIRPLRDGKIVGFPGLLASVAAFKVAHVAGKEAQL